MKTSRILVMLLVALMLIFVAGCNNDGTEDVAVYGYSLNYDTCFYDSVGESTLNSDNVYEIYDLDGLRAWLNSPEDCDAILYSCLDFSEADWTWILRTGYTKTFDGNKHTIYNLHINGSSSDGYVGFIGTMSDEATIQNLYLYNPTITGETTAGGIAGMIECDNSPSQTSIYNCRVIGGTITGETTAGGIAGSISYLLNSSSSSVMIEGCTNTASVTSTIAGGIVGQISMNSDIDLLAISNSINSGTITGTTAGGIVGANTYGELTNNVNTGIVNNTSPGANVGSSPS